MKLSPTMERAMKVAREGDGLRYLRGGFWVKANSDHPYNAYDMPEAREALLDDDYFDKRTVVALIKRGLLADDRDREFLNRASLS